MENGKDIANAMLEVQHAIEVAARIKAIRVELDDFITSKLYDVEGLSETDHLTFKLNCAAEAIRATTLRSILRSMDHNYISNSMDLDPKEHMDRLLRMMKD